MNASLRALLAESIDYAGMFPPAGLSLVGALDQYRLHRAGAESWMLGRFVVPAAQLTELGALDEFEQGSRFTVLVPAAKSGAALLKELDQTLTLVGKLPVAGTVDTLEFRWPAELLNDADGSRLKNLVQAAAGRIVASQMTPITMYFELPPVNEPGERGRQTMAVASALAGYNEAATGLNCQAGFKLRCGGAQAGDVPSSALVALVIYVCHRVGIFWKATAGLHHALRHTDPAFQVPVCGFLNLFCAALLADFCGLEIDEIIAVIDDEDTNQFVFSDSAISWREYVVPTEQIAAARARSLRSFGSCSFEDPCQDLKELRLF